MDSTQLRKQFHGLTREQILDWLITFCNYNPAFFNAMSDELLKAWVIPEQYQSCLVYNARQTLAACGHLNQL